jgi:hypothetical protein
MGLLCTVPPGLVPADVPCAKTGVAMRAARAHAIAEVFTNFIHFSWIFCDDRVGCVLRRSPAPDRFIA